MRCSMMQRQAGPVSFARGASSAAAPLASRPVGRATRLVIRAGLLDFLQLPGGNKGPAPNQRASVVISELLSLAEATAAGTRASADRREEIQELAEELKQFSVRNAARSKLLFGEWEVLYASAPGAPGSPLAGPSGVVSVGSQPPIEIIEEDGTFESKVEFKQLGFLSGSYRRSGSIRPAGGDSYQLDITETAYQTGLPGGSTKSVDDSYKVQILYLGEQLRVVEVGADGGDEDGVLLVLKRVQGGNEEDDEEEEEQASGSFGLFSAKASSPGIATISERQVRRQMEQEEAKRSGKPSGSAKIAAGTGKVGGGTGKLGASGTDKLKAIAAGAAGSAKLAVAGRAPPAVDEAKAARDRAAAEKKAEAERKAEADRRAAAQKQAEAEKKAAAERQGAIRELLASLTDALRGRQAETKEAVAELREVERAAQAALKKSAAAASSVEKAENETEETEEALSQAVSTQRSAAAKLNEAKAALSQAQAKVAALSRGSR